MSYRRSASWAATLADAADRAIFGKPGVERRYVKCAAAEEIDGEGRGWTSMWPPSGRSRAEASPTNGQRQHDALHKSKWNAQLGAGGRIGDTRFEDGKQAGLFIFRSEARRRQGDDGTCQADIAREMMNI